MATCRSSSGSDCGAGSAGHNGGCPTTLLTQQRVAIRQPLEVQQPSFVPGLQRSALPRFHRRDAPARLPRRCTSPTWHCWTAGPAAWSRSPAGWPRGPAPDGRHGWKQPCLRPRLGIPPCRSSGGGWKTRFISPWQDGILLPIPARGAAG